MGHASYVGKIKGGGHLEIEVAPASNRVTHMFFQSKRVMRCRRGTDSDVGLWQTPFRVGPTGHAVKRERYGDKAGDKHALMTWDLRFAPDWTTVIVRVSDRYQHNTFGGCSGTFKTTALRVAPRGSWQLGRYSGTTSQGFTVTFASGWTRLQGLDLLEFPLTDVTATVRFPCPSGAFTAAVTPDANDQGDGLLSVEPTPGGGKMYARLTPAGASDPTATLEGVLVGSSASGTLMLTGECGNTEFVDATSISFNASRVG